MPNQRPVLTTVLPSQRFVDDLPADRVPTVWDPRYVSKAAPLTSTTKAGLVINAHRKDLAFLQVRQPRDLDPVWAHIASWHDRKYVKAVRTGRNRSLAESQGFTWSPEFADSVARVWFGQHFAQRLARKTGRAVLHPVSGAHHAHPDMGGGFCTFNYAVAALMDVAETDPHCVPAVIDLDAHWGDGTAAFAAHNPRLRVFDVHGRVQNKRELFHSGRSVDHGVRDITAYWDALAELPAWLEAQGVTDAVYLAGMDPYVDDMVGGIDGMTSGALFSRDLFVISLLEAHGISTVVNFAGGYVPEKVVELHGNTIRAMQASQHTLSLVGRLLQPAATPAVAVGQ